MTDPTVHPCGCVNAIDAPSGVLRSVSKCRRHLAGARDPATLDAAYYRELGVIDEAGRLRPTNHVAELAEALGALPMATPAYPFALEVGCGASPYVGAIQAAGWRYFGVDPSAWAAGWMSRREGVEAACARLEEVGPNLHPGLILAAHCIEHMPDAPGAIRRCADLLAPGGELWVVVPDDEDPCNPDHLWFFTPATLRSCLEAAGLVVEREATRRYVKHESFLYARARKPVS